MKGLTFNMIMIINNKKLLNLYSKMYTFNEKYFKFTHKPFKN